MSKNNSLTTRDLQQLAGTARDHLECSSRVAEKFIARYGITYNDVDCDELIEVLDYSCGHISLKEADRYMTAVGYPPILCSKSEEV